MLRDSAGSMIAAALLLFTLVPVDAVGRGLRSVGPSRGRRLSSGEFHVRRPFQICPKEFGEGCNYTRNVPSMQSAFGLEYVRRCTEKSVECTAKADITARESA